MQTAKALAEQTDVSPFTRMAMLFQACQNSSVAFLRQNHNASSSVQDLALLHQKYLNYVISELKPALTEIISQGIENGEIHFDSVGTVLLSRDKRTVPNFAYFL